MGGRGGNRVFKLSIVKKNNRTKFSNQVFGKGENHVFCIMLIYTRSL